MSAQPSLRRPDYKRHWFCETKPGRIAWAIKKGWTYVKPEGSENVARFEEGDGIMVKYLLMEISEADFAVLPKS